MLRNDFSEQRYIILNATIPGQEKIKINRIKDWVKVETRKSQASFQIIQVSVSDKTLNLFKSLSRIRLK